MILTTENINAVLGLVLKDKTLDETIDGLMGGKLSVLKDVANAAIEDPSLLVDTVIKVLAAKDYEVEDLAVLYDTLAVQLDYFETDAEHDKVDLALNKLDAVLNNAIDDVFVILKDLDNMPALLKEIPADATTSITALANYFLGEYAFTDSLMNTIVGAIAGIFAGMDANTFKTVSDLLNQILGVNIGLDAFKTGDNLAEYFGGATTWSEVTVNKEYAWGFETAEDKAELFIDIILEVVAPFSKVLDFLFRGDNVTLLVDGLQLKGGNGWANVIVPLGKALGMDLAVADTADATACVESLLRGILGLVEDQGLATP